jgi:MFS family permease
MSDRPSSRIGAATGLAYFVLVFAGNAIATSGSTTDDTSTGAEILRDLQAHHGAAFHVGLAMELLGFAALLGFVAYLSAVLRHAEGEHGWLWLTALGGGLLTLAIKLSSAAPLLAAVWRVDELDPTTARTLVDVNGFAFFVSFGTFAMFVGPAGLVALRSGLLPRWLAAAGVVVAVAQVVTMAFGLHPAAVVPFLLSAVWLAAVSTVLVRHAHAAIGRPSRSTGGVGASAQSGAATPALSAAIRAK